jgi:hypothetical protein
MSDLEAISWKDYITPTVAIVGAVLGIVNLAITIGQRRVRLSIRPTQAVGAKSYCIEVVNLSSFPVTISKVGFCRIGATGKRRVPINKPIVSGDWPKRLQSREAVLISFDPREDIRARETTINVYASTSCGKIVDGSTQAFKRFQKELAS